MVVLAIVAILVILLVIRPLMARAFERSDGGAGEDEAERLLTDQSGAPAQLTGPGALAQDLALEDAQAGEELEQMIDINRVEGRRARLVAPQGRRDRGQASGRGGFDHSKLALPGNLNR